MECAPLRLWTARAEFASHLHRFADGRSRRCGLNRIALVRVRGKQRWRCLEPENATTAEFQERDLAERDLPPASNDPVKYYVSGDNAIEATEGLLKVASTATILEDNAPEAPAFLQDDDSTNLVEEMRQIFAFAGPALGIWLSGPIMSLIDTSVVGITSSIELAALGPGTVVCDGLGYCFLFLSVAISNLVAISLAKKDETEAANHLARFLFVAVSCGVVMFTVIKLSSRTMLHAFVGGNTAVIPAAACYVDIRAFAWPAVLVTMVGQGASLGMQDSVSPLKVLAVVSLINAVGDVLLCTFLGYGIAGAAWATMLAQYVGGFLTLKSLKDKGYDPLAIKVPRMEDLAQMIKITGPVLLTMLSKVAFYTSITFFATSLGAVTLAAHQVMVGVFSLFSVWGEPLAQTAQSFMPGLLCGGQHKQARRLLQKLLASGVVLGIASAVVGISIPVFLPQLFTNDSAIIEKMHTVVTPFFFSIALTPPALALEGTLLASGDLNFLGINMAFAFVCGTVLMLVFHKLGFGLSSCWWTMVLFQMSRFIASFSRLTSSKNILNNI
ncbi:protein DETOXIFICATION 46, chloroplastic [Selaginella moellendorffii]|uniref:protein DETOXIFICATION 46, chloroplastic n=1 Tax=Selaginella moellendorffii TaxID=88036 RepID=UPI000D1C3EAF|nr:protein DETOXIFICATION 46, chloroplastic [Selaginella moellendorffii]|eukprot:XP_024531497.1 protein DETOXIFICATION 46, chloroplastic [Selaginella moellendorffii]